MNEFSLEGRLRQIEEKLDLILAHLGIKYVAPPKPEWQRFADRGMKIDAIKAYRGQYGLGLNESKAAVERYQRGLGPPGYEEGGDAATAPRVIYSASVTTREVWEEEGL
jgi:hypothetical protein